MKDSTALKLLKKYCVAKIQKLEAEEDVLTDYSSAHNAGEQMAYKDILSFLEEDEEE